MSIKHKREEIKQISLKSNKNLYSILNYDASQSIPRLKHLWNKKILEATKFIPLTLHFVLRSSNATGLIAVQLQASVGVLQERLSGSSHEGASLEESLLLLLMFDHERRNLRSFLTPATPILVTFVLSLQRVQHGAHLFHCFVEIYTGSYQLVTLLSSGHQLLPSLRHVLGNVSDALWIVMISTYQRISSVLDLKQREKNFNLKICFRVNSSSNLLQTLINWRKKLFPLRKTKLPEQPRCESSRWQLEIARAPLEVDRRLASSRGLWGRPVAWLRRF